VLLCSLAVVPGSRCSTKTAPIPFSGLAVLYPTVQLLGSVLKVPRSIEEPLGKYANAIRSGRDAGGEGSHQSTACQTRGK